MLEHSAYCDGQREEEPDGFFFDNMRPEFDSDCEGDPFSNNYLTEDELEFPAEYTPAPYVPGRVMDAVWHAYSVQGMPLPRVAAKFGLPVTRVSAIINLKATEPAMRASGRYDERIDAQLTDLYAGRFGSPSAGADRMPPAQAAEEAAAVGLHRPQAPLPGDSLDIGPKGALLHDDEDVDEVLPPSPRAAATGDAHTVLRVGHTLPRLPTPPKAARVHDSKFVFRDISGRGSNNARLVNPLVASGWDGATRPATNRETLYRSWETRHWTPARDAKGSTKNWPFADAEADKERKRGGYHVPP